MVYSVQHTVYCRSNKYTLYGIPYIVKKQGCIQRIGYQVLLKRSTKIFRIFIKISVDRLLKMLYTVGVGRVQVLIKWGFDKMTDPPYTPSVVSRRGVVKLYFLSIAGFCIVFPPLYRSLENGRKLKKVVADFWGLWFSWCRSIESSVGQREKKNAESSCKILETC